MKRLLLAGALLAAMLPATAAARGVVVMRPAFRPFGYGWYGPGWGWGDPFYMGYGYGPYGYWGVPNAGTVKLDTKDKAAQVFINGNYAGTVKELKSMTMKPGNYSIEVRSPGHEPFQQKIHVTAGKTMKLKPELGTN